MTISEVKSQLQSKKFQDNMWLLQVAMACLIPSPNNKRRPHPPPVIINDPGGQKLFIIRGAHLLKGFGRAAFKFLLKSIKIELKSRIIYNSINNPFESITIELKSR